MTAQHIALPKTPCANKKRKSRVAACLSAINRRGANFRSLNDQLNRNAGAVSEKPSELYDSDCLSRIA